MNPNLNKCHYLYSFYTQWFQFWFLSVLTKYLEMAACFDFLIRMLTGYFYGKNFNCAKICSTQPFFTNTNVSCTYLLQ